MRKLDKEKGVYVQDLKACDVVEVETENHIYSFTVLDPGRKIVRGTSNGYRFTKPTILHIEGSFITMPYKIEDGWIGIGHRLLIHPRLILSTTQTISVNGEKILPKE